MITLIQRVSQANVAVAGEVIAEIGRGLLVLVGVARGDTQREAERLAERVLRYRIFADGEGRMNLSVREVEGAVLLVPQFTLAADWRKGRRPSFTAAAPPDEARRLLERLGAGLSARGVSVATGSFGASMRVALVNEGPFTLLLDSRERPAGRPPAST